MRAPTSPGSVGNLTAHRLGIFAQASFVALGQLFDETIDLFAVNQVNGSATKASACEPGAVAAGEIASDFDQNVELFGAVFEEVARTLVALEHVLTELNEVAIAQGPCAKNDTLDLADDVVGALVL